MNIKIIEKNKAVIFDWSGTLSDNFDSFYFVVNKFCMHFGRDVPEKEEVRNRFTIPYMKFWNQLFPALDITLQKQLYEKYIHEAPEAKPIDGVLILLQNLKNKGYKIFILSSDPKSKIISEIDTTRINDIINGVVCDVHDKAKALADLVQKEGLDNSNTYYIGDSVGDIECGKVAKLKTIGVTWGFSTRNRIIDSKPDEIVDNINEIMHYLK